MSESPPVVARPEGARRAKVLIGGGIVVLVLVGLVTWAMGREGSTAFYLTVSEVTARGEGAGAAVRVNGTVVPGSIDTQGLRTDFRITDGTQEMSVTTESPMPDTFRDHSEVVALGRYESSSFLATQVLAKCPSKFKAKA